MSRKDYEHLELDSHLELFSNKILFDSLYEINLGTRVFTVMELEKRLQKQNKNIMDIKPLIKRIINTPAVSELHITEKQLNTVLRYVLLVLEQQEERIHELEKK